MNKYRNNTQSHDCVKKCIATIKMRRNRPCIDCIDDRRSICHRSRQATASLLVNLLYRYYTSQKYFISLSHHFFHLLFHNSIIQQIVFYF